KVRSGGAHGRGAAAGRVRGGGRPRAAPRSAGDHPGQAPGRGKGGPGPEGSMVGSGPVRGYGARGGGEREPGGRGPHRLSVPQGPRGVVELREAIRRRRMWRTYQDRPVDAVVLERI